MAVAVTMDFAGGTLAQYDQVVARWTGTGTVWDALGLLQQVGAVPAPA
jgi:hypothetical protein